MLGYRLYSLNDILRLFTSIGVLLVSLFYLYIVFGGNGVLSYYPVYLYVALIIWIGFILWRYRLVYRWIIELIIAILLVFPVLDTAILFSLSTESDLRTSGASPKEFRVCYQNIGNEFWYNMQEILEFYASKNCDAIGFVEVWLPMYPAYVGVDNKTQVRFANKIMQLLQENTFGSKYPFIVYKGEYLLLSRFPIRASLGSYESYLNVYLYTDESGKQPFVNIILIHVWTPLIKSPYILKSKIDLLGNGYFCKADVCFTGKWRQYQEREIQDFLLKNTRNRFLRTLIVGDFNALPSYSLISQLAVQYKKVGHLFHVPTFYRRFPAIQIDHAFIKGVFITNFAMVNTPFSDHKGLVLDISFVRK